MGLSTIFHVLHLTFSLLLPSTVAQLCTIVPWKPLANSDLYGFRKIASEKVPTRRECMHRCDSLGSQCIAFSFTYSQASSQCKLLASITLPVSSSQLVIPKSQDDVMVRNTDGLVIPTLVFRATKGTGNEVYNFYLSDVSSSRTQFRSAHDLTNTTQQPFKHPRLVQQPWSIQKLTLRLWRSGAVVVDLVFETENAADRMDWFSYGRLRNSSYADLNPSGGSTIASFTIKSNEKRSFWISKFGGNCQDGGWVAVIDGNDFCSWGNFGSYPQFLYSSSGSGIVWGSEGTAFADDFVLVADVKV